MFLIENCASYGRNEYPAAKKGAIEVRCSLLHSVQSAVAAATAAALLLVGPIGEVFIYAYQVLLVILGVRISQVIKPPYCELKT